MERSALAAKPVVRVRGLRCGYRPPEALVGEVVAAGERNVAVSVGLAVGDLVVVYGSALVGWAVLSAGVSWWVGLPVVGLVLLVMGRGLRGSECVVHEASHRTISARAQVNDRLGDWLAAIPVFSTVGSFRASHMRHHNRFGVARRPGFESFDPDLDRFVRLGMDRLEWGSWWRFVAGMARCLPRYFAAWFSAIGSSPAVLAMALAWHGTLFAVLALSLGWAATTVVYGLWAAAFVVVLPVYRFVGEAQEHDYSAGDSQFATTISNTGRLNWWLHPHGDGHHVEHHVFPTRPGFRLGRLSDALVADDPQVWGAAHLHRSRVLKHPTRGHGNGAWAGGWGR